jgi:hypothetical protein
LCQRVVGSENGIQATSVHIQDDFHAAEGFWLHAHLQLPLPALDLADQAIGQGLAHAVRQDLGLFDPLLKSGPNRIGSGLWTMCRRGGGGALTRGARLAHWRTIVVG